MTTDKPVADDELPEPDRYHGWTALYTADQMHAAIARERAQADGLREGYVQGWRWGLSCGAIAGALVVGIAWIGWLWAYAPGAAPL